MHLWDLSSTVMQDEWTQLENKGITAARVFTQINSMVEDITQWSESTKRHSVTCNIFDVRPKGENSELHIKLVFPREGMLFFV